MMFEDLEQVELLNEQQSIRWLEFFLLLCLLRPLLLLLPLAHRNLAGPYFPELLLYLFVLAWSLHRFFGNSLSPESAIFPETLLENEPVRRV